MLETLRKGLLKKGVLTKNYPAEPHRPAAGYHGIPVVETPVCKLCGKCAIACPTKAIAVDARVEVSLGRCIFCAACVDACPRGAMRMGGDFELASRTDENLKVVY